MNPIKDIQDVIQNWDKFEKNWKSLYAFLLYTDEDRNLAVYVRENFMNLDQLTGKLCLVFLIDEPSKVWRQEAKDRDYWNEFQLRQGVWKGFTESRPYEKAKAYKIAEHLSVPPNSMPCIVFFKDIRDDDLLIYSLGSSSSADNLSKQFREVFSVIAKSIKNLDGEVVDMTKEGIEKKRQAIWKNLKTYIKKQKAKGLTTQVIDSPVVKSIGDVLKKIAVDRFV